MPCTSPNISCGAGRPVPAEAETRVTLALENGSRIVSLLGKEGTIRSYSGVRLLVIDEAAARRRRPLPDRAAHAGGQQRPAMWAEIGQMQFTAAPEHAVRLTHSELLVLTGQEGQDQT